MRERKRATATRPLLTVCLPRHHFASSPSLSHQPVRLTVALRAVLTGCACGAHIRTGNAVCLSANAACCHRIFAHAQCSFSQHARRASACCSVAFFLVCHLIALAALVRCSSSVKDSATQCCSLGCSCMLVASMTMLGALQPTFVAATHVRFGHLESLVGFVFFFLFLHGIAVSKTSVLTVVCHVVQR